MESSPMLGVPMAAMTPRLAPGVVTVSSLPGYDGRTMKSKFTPEEDERLKSLVMLHGTNSWTFISHLMGTRNRRQCRERWKNYLNPELRNEPWTFEEDQLLVDKYAQFGPKWNKLAKFFTNRSDNSIRNRWQLMLRQWERQHNPSHFNQEPDSTQPQENESNEK